MFKIEYEIKKNEKGEMYVAFSDKNENLPEHKFMFMEMARWLIHDILDKNSLKKKLSKETVIELFNAEKLLYKLSFEMSNILNKQDNILNDLLKDTKVKRNKDE